MAELSKETFLVLAEQAGFDPKDPHLDDLYPDVQLMFARTALLMDAPTDNLEPGLRFPGSDL
jgi:hypothetical protein